MFLYHRGTVHFYSLAAELFYSQVRGTLFNVMQFRLTVLNIYLRFYVCLNEAKTTLNCGKYFKIPFKQVVICSYLLYEVMESTHCGSAQFNYK